MTDIIKIEMDAITMAPLNTPKKKQWIFHGKIDGKMHMVVVNVGSDQFQLVEATIAASCA